MRWDDSIDPPFAVPLCDWCGQEANWEDVDDHGVRVHQIGPGGECPTQTCRCRFCRNDPVIWEQRGGGPWERLR
jgi:hypothetical protein